MTIAKEAEDFVVQYFKEKRGSPSPKSPSGKARSFTSSDRSWPTSGRTGPDFLLHQPPEVN